MTEPVRTYTTTKEELERILNMLHDAHSLGENAEDDNGKCPICYAIEALDAEIQRSFSDPPPTSPFGRRITPRA